mmetsp:Transcript_23072/g.75215  ORF Transcript_23072/g.75215 Transcript_23072/m.75215 type:complete len:387 (+) Transcript_23072:391-1551(+)
MQPIHEDRTLHLCVSALEVLERRVDGFKDALELAVVPGRQRVLEVAGKLCGDAVERDERRERHGRISAGGNGGCGGEPALQRWRNLRKEIEQEVDVRLVVVFGQHSLEPARLLPRQRQHLVVEPAQPRYQSLGHLRPLERAAAGGGLCVKALPLLQNGRIPRRHEAALERRIATDRDEDARNLGGARRVVRLDRRHERRLNRRFQPPLERSHALPPVRKLRHRTYHRERLPHRRQRLGHAPDIARAKHLVHRRDEVCQPRSLRKRVACSLHPPLHLVHARKQVDAPRRHILSLFEPLEDGAHARLQRPRVCVHATHLLHSLWNAVDTSGTRILERKAQVLGQELELHLQLPQVLLERVLRGTTCHRLIHPRLGIKGGLAEGAEVCC